MKHLTHSSILAVALLAMAQSAFAHGFHYQISVDTALKTDAQGNLIGLQMRWLHDAEVSKAMLEDEDLSPAHREQTLQQIATRLLHDLHPYSYYTQLQVNGQELTPAEVTDYTLTVSDDQRMQLDFLLPLTPTALQGKTVSWNMLDPDGMGILRYADNQHLSLGANPPAQCQFKLEAAPTTTAEEASATSQTVTLSCP